ncbi:hypothetical protein ACHAXT_012740 [Thalassiosira profunda]
MAGMEAYGGERGAISNDDKRSEFTYGEFPFESFDLLVDPAMEFLPQKSGDRSRTMVDLGSGCGRLVFYAALTRGESDQWDVYGVEIGTQLHSLAVNSLQRGIERGWFESTTTANSGEGSRIGFHNGNALLTEDPYYNQSPSSDATHANIRSLLSQTDLLFAYSTVWETNPSRPFDPELGAMVLSPKWSKAFSELCPEGCVAITTDRALDPQDGWRLVDRMDVENPSVWGSTGFVSVLERR